MAGQHDMPYPGAVQAQHDDLERRVRIIEKDLREFVAIRADVAVMSERMSNQGRELGEMRRAITWLTRSLIGATGLLTVATAFLIKFSEGG